MYKPNKLCYTKLKRWELAPSKCRAKLFHVFCLRVLHFHVLHFHVLQFYVLHLAAFSCLAFSPLAISMVRHFQSTPSEEHAAFLNISTVTHSTVYVDLLTVDFACVNVIVSYDILASTANGRGGGRVRGLCFRVCRLSVHPSVRLCVVLPLTRIPRDAISLYLVEDSMKLGTSDQHVSSHCWN